jgi:hypothetical protein
VVSEDRRGFTITMLTEIKAEHEKMIERTKSNKAGAAVTFFVHTAFFSTSDAPHYFLKVANEGSDTIQLDHLWFATDPPVIIANPRRPLPTLLEPGSLFETWQPVENVPTHPLIDYFARLKLSDGSVVESRHNPTVLPVGSVGGGGQPLESLIKSVRAANHDGDRLIKKEWDVFVSYAHEDKAAAARLVDELRTRNIRTWYDSMELRIGDHLSTKIDQGVAGSAFGVIILSHQFFDSAWGRLELNGLIARSVDDGQIVLPIWHGVTFDDVVAFNPSLASIVAIDSAKVGLAQIADEIHEVIVKSRRAQD